MIASSTMIATHCAADLMAILRRWETQLGYAQARMVPRAHHLHGAPIATAGQCVPPLTGAVLPGVGDATPPAEPGGGNVVEPLIAFGCTAGAGRVVAVAGTLGGVCVLVAGA
jgi:hypothetical protein